MIGQLFIKVKNAVEQARLKSNYNQKQISLIAVSKTKPIQAIQQVYDLNHRDFGENYVDELLSKSVMLPLDIKWHFIGHLQSNKIATLLKVPNLYCIQTVDSEKLAQKINKKCYEQQRIINILVQVKLSNEKAKFGLDVEQTQQLVFKIINDFQNLCFRGFMTIGEEDDLDVFSKLFMVRNQVCAKLNLIEQDYELSMGMSADYNEAILNGSTIVRVGSSIFGNRDYQNIQQQQQEQEQQQQQQQQEKQQLQLQQQQQEQEQEQQEQQQQSSQQK